MKRRTPASGVRRRAFRRGLRAEVWASVLLRIKGYRILARRERTPAGEIDLIVKRNATLAFVEVKARASPDLAILSLAPRQQRRIERAAALWCARRPWTGGLNVRFDIVTAGRWRIRHIPDAWRPEA